MQNNTEKSRPVNLCECAKVRESRKRCRVALDSDAVAVDYVPKCDRVDEHGALILDLSWRTARRAVVSPECIGHEFLAPWIRFPDDANFAKFYASHIDAEFERIARIEAAARSVIRAHKALLACDEVQRRHGYDAGDVYMHDFDTCALCMVHRAVIRLDAEITSDTVTP